MHGTLCPLREGSRRMQEPTDETHGPGLRVGSTSEFSLFFRVKPGHQDDLRQALRALNNSPGYRSGDYDLPVATIHEARFVMFDDDTRLLFATSFDGTWDAYMEDFASTRCSCTWRDTTACPMSPP